MKIGSFREITRNSNLHRIAVISNRRNLKFQNFVQNAIIENVNINNVKVCNIEKKFSKCP